MNKTAINLKPFLDDEGRIVKLPAKRAVRMAVLGYLAEKFEFGPKYREKEINMICDRWHTFQDYFVLRRGLVDEGFLMREKDGSYYWRESEREVKEHE